MNPKGYEHCWIGNEKIDMPAGIDALYESLSKRFPDEKKRLKKYLALVRNVSHQIQLIPKMNGFWDNITIPFRTRHMGKYGLFSLKRVIDWHIKDPLLKAVLNVQCGDHGLPPSRASFPIHCAVMDHYFERCFLSCRVVVEVLLKLMTNALKRYGGEIRTKQHVKKIIIDNRQAIGVKLEERRRNIC